MHLVHRNTCRVCGSSALTPVIQLGEQFLQGSFVKPGREMPPTRKIPMILQRCDPTRDEHACGLLQMRHSVPPDILYSAYWYRSGTNQTMRDHLRGIAHEAADLIAIEAALVLDIGCNDGTLLSYYPEAFERIGVDPSDVAQSVLPPIQVIQDVFPSPELSARLGERKIDIITSIAMFYDLEDPIAFAKAVGSSLAPNGLWVFEMSYMPTMLEMNSYDTICHEHLEYYSLTVIEFILRRAGLKIVNATLNSINGGSIRCHAAHIDSFRWKTPAFAENLRRLRQREFDLELDTDKPYRHFQDRIDLHRTELTELLSRLKAEGKRIHVYGASTKGNTILQWCGIDHTVVDVAAERNPDKFGAFTLGTNIPIVSEQESRALKPDYYLVLPWHFRDEFVQREREVLDSGVGFIFPLPTVHVYRSPATTTQGPRQ